MCKTMFFTKNGQVLMNAFFENRFWLYDITKAGILPHNCSMVSLFLSLKILLTKTTRDIKTHNKNTPNQTKSNQQYSKFLICQFVTYL